AVSQLHGKTRANDAGVTSLRSSLHSEISSAGVTRERGTHCRIRSGEFVAPDGARLEGTPMVGQRLCEAQPCIRGDGLCDITGNRQGICAACLDIPARIEP